MLLFDIRKFAYVVSPLLSDPTRLICIDLVIPMDWVNSLDISVTTSYSSNAHMKQISQFIISIASDPSAPEALESLNTTHMTSYSKKLRVSISSTSL